MLGNKEKEEFQVVPISSPNVEKLVNDCIQTYRGNPSWVSDKDHVKTINFAKALCSETARLTTLGIGVFIDGSTRAEWLQEQIDKVKDRLRKWVEYGCACGTIIIKPNYNSVDIYFPGDYVITDVEGGDITGVIFIDRAADEINKRYYTRLEHHRFENDGSYAITNRCKVGSSPNDTSKEIAIERTPWIGLSEEETIQRLIKPLFSPYNTPHANNVDMASPVSLPLISDVLEELRDLDVAYSRNAKEIDDSKRTVLIDADRMLPGFGDNTLNRTTLPDYIKLVDGVTDGSTEVYHEINPSLNTETRIAGINALLNQIGYKAGYSNGHFVFNESTGIQTATGVEAEQQRTIQLVADYRNELKNCMDGLVYALNAFADLYNLAPAGKYEIAYDFDDITHNVEEDRARCYSWVNSGKYPFWRYLVEYEGYTEKEAKEIAAEMQQSNVSLFGEE